MRAPLTLPLALGVLALAAPAASAAGANGRLLITSDRAGNSDVWSVNPDGSDPRNLTNHPGYDFGGVASPDGKKILFTSLRVGSVGYDLYVMDADGGHPTNLTHGFNGQNAGGVWSPDGSRIAWTSGGPGSGDIWVMNADGTGKANLTNAPGEDSAPAWSPDGSRIAFSSMRTGDVGQIWIMHADGSGKARVTRSAEPGQNLRPVFSPDGRMLAFASLRPSVSGSEDVFVIGTDGSGEHNITADGSPHRLPAGGGLPSGRDEPDSWMADPSRPAPAPAPVAFPPAASPDPGAPAPGPVASPPRAAPALRIQATAAHRMRVKVALEHAACRGTVAIKLTSGRRVLTRRTVALSATCESRLSLRLPKRVRTVRVTASHARLRATTTVRVRREAAT